MTEVGVLMVPMDDRIAQDLDRWGISSTMRVPEGVVVEAHVARAVRGNAATIFATPTRRWREVMGAVRAACQVVAGGVTLRFYQPDCVIDVRNPIDDAGDRYGVCPFFDPAEAHTDAEACMRLKRALKDGISDLIGAEMRAMRAEAMAAHARIAHLLPRVA